MNGSMVELAAGLKLLGLWDRTLVLTYSEFGRRVEENRNGGTDHGTANVHFVMGGAVRGGRLYGQAPSLERLDQGNLQHTTDFRSVYATLVKQWWRQTPIGALAGASVSQIPFLKG